MSGSRSSRDRIGPPPEAPREEALVAAVQADDAPVQVARARGPRTSSEIARYAANAPTPSSFPRTARTVPGARYDPMHVPLRPAPPSQADAGIARSCARDPLEPAQPDPADVRGARRGTPRAGRDVPGRRAPVADLATAEAERAAAAGVGGVLLFGLPETKDAEGSSAWDDEGPVQVTTRAIRAAAPGLVIATDVCLCQYTDHGHCGVLARRRHDRQRRDAAAARPGRGLATPGPAPT